MNKINKIEGYDADDEETFEIESYSHYVTLRVLYMHQWITLKSKVYEKDTDVDLLGIYNNMDAVEWSDEISNEEFEEEKKEIDNDLKATRLRRQQKQ
jgi:hypothetical protein